MAKPPPSTSTRPATNIVQKGAQPVAVHNPIKPQGGSQPTTGHHGGPGTPPNQGSGGKK
jgi:hypothetical protein